MIDRTFDLQPADAERRVLLILGVGPDKEKQPGYQRTYAMLRDWAAANPDYQVLIKAHPRSLASFWRQAAETLDNLQVLPADCGLADALSWASVVVNIMSNAVIEAALARRPVIHANASGEHDIFAQARFLGASVVDLSGLTARLDGIAAAYPACVASAERFAEFHLAHGVDGLGNTLLLLDELLADGHCAGQTLLPSNSIYRSRSQ
jgi:hypothetical protein